MSASFINGDPLFPISPDVLRERGRLLPILISYKGMHHSLLNAIQDDGAQLITYPSHGGSNQIWKIDGQCIIIEDADKAEQC